MRAHVKKDVFWRKHSVGLGSAKVAVDGEGRSVELVLYKYDTCVFCVRVMRLIADLDIPVRYRDTRVDPEAKADLLQLGGKTQVPCLVINGRPMYESASICEYLSQEIEIRTEP